MYKFDLAPLLWLAAIGLLTVATAAVAAVFLLLRWLWLLCF
jgi:hypothetical protein